MKIAIIDKIGLCYDGDTLLKQGLGGSESAVILISKELAKLGFEVTVYNNCKDGSNSKPGVYDSVRYIDNSEAKINDIEYDIVIVSRTIMPFISNDWPFIHTAKKRILWLHDTFIEGDQMMEDLVVSGKIDHIFTLSDWHTSYILTCAHGKKRNYEVLKKSIFQTRNGAVQHISEVDLSKKDPKHFVYNANATKGMIPLIENIWPKIREKLPDAHLTIIGGYYRFKEGASPDAQENTVEKLSKRTDLKDLGVTFTGIITQKEIADILSNSWMMLYPGVFPETFGISSLESLLYKTPLVTTRFGALEETAIDLACYHIDYAIEPNSLFPHINKEEQVQKFVNKFFEAYSTPYLHQQKQNYCDVIKDVFSWDTVALQWKQFFYSVLGEFLPIDEYRNVTRINDKVSRVFGRTSNMPLLKEYRSFGKERPITVISPFWNAAPYIEKHILSVASQDYDNYIHVLIDDASDDDSYKIAQRTIASLPEHLQKRFYLRFNEENFGCIGNQMNAIKDMADEEDIVMLLDGDDWLINNNTIFKYYNDLYDQGYEFTYGSMWSVVDNIPLIAQEYPTEVKKNRTYRSHLFNWKIPYTHLRTCLGKHCGNLDVSKFQVDGKWMKSGADNPLFYELIERIDPEKIYCNREIVCNYNDANPLNDYKIRGDEQNKNANKSYTNKKMLTDVVDGKQFFRMNDDVSWDLIKDDWVNHHKDMISKIASHRNGTVIQAGGNQGLYPTLLSDYFKKVYTFEPNPANYEVLCMNCNKENIISQNLALGANSETRYNLSNHQPNNFGTYKVSENENGSQLTKKLDDLLDESVDLLWLDVELYEKQVLEGTTGIISKYKPIIIIEGPEATGFASSEYVKSLGYVKTARFYNDEVYEHIESKKVFKEDNNVIKKKILVAIPTAKYVEVQTFKSLWDLKVPDGYELDFQYFYGYNISQIRNLIADWAKRYDYLLSIDSDIVLPKDALEKMLTADKDIISGLYIQRIPGTQTVEVYMDAPNGGCKNIPYSLLEKRGVVEIAACGMGCALIKSEVFKKMEYPHFFYKEALDHRNTVSEDVYFCMKARGIGFKVWADASIKCDHVGTAIFSLDTQAEQHIDEITSQDLLPKESVQYLENMKANPKVIYDIGSCVLHWERHAKRIWPSSEVYLFEANRDVKKLYDRTNQKYHLGVLTDVDNKAVKFYKDPLNLGGNSYYKENTIHYNETHAIHEIGKTLDTIVKENNWPTPDLIKIDVQGAEVDILKGATECISKCNDVILEVQHIEYNIGAPKHEEVFQFMKSIGFELVTSFGKNNVDADYHFKRIE